MVICRYWQVGCSKSCWGGGSSDRLGVKTLTCSGSYENRNLSCGVFWRFGLLIHDTYQVACGNTPKRFIGHQVHKVLLLSMRSMNRLSNCLLEAVALVSEQGYSAAEAASA